MPLLAEARPLEMGLVQEGEPPFRFSPFAKARLLSDNL